VVLFQATGIHWPRTMRPTCHARGFTWAVLVGLIACRHAALPNRGLERPLPATRGPELAASWLHSCAIRCNGQVWCWGAARYLGQADDAERRVPVEVAVSGARAIVAGRDRTCAIVGDERSVVCWGPLPFRGGADPRLPRSTSTAPAEVGLKWATELSLDRWDSCAILGYGGSSGRGSPAVCWGQDTGIGWEHLTGFYWPSAPVEHFSTSYVGRCTQHAGGRLDCWTDNPELERLNHTLATYPITGALALGPHGFCRITAQRRVACSRGPDQVLVVDDPRLADITSLHVGRVGFCAVDARGSVHCWDHRRDNAALLRRVPFEHPVRAISLGWNHGCGVTTSGEILCWGANRHGQLGDGTVDDSVIPVPVAFPEQCS
jgi:hypothetical protein